MTTNFFSPLSFVAVFGSGIRDPGSGMGKNQDPGSGINIPDPQHWFLNTFIKAFNIPNRISSPAAEWTRGPILKRNWDKSLLSFPPCYSQSSLLKDFTPSHPLSISGLKLVCNVNFVHKNPKSDHSQDYAQKPQRNYTFMNSTSGNTAG